MTTLMWRCLLGAILMAGCWAVGASAQTGDKEKATPEWSDVLLVEQPLPVRPMPGGPPTRPGEVAPKMEQVISYRTGWVVYEESLTKGQFVGRGWNGSGFVSYYDGRIDPEEHRMPEAFSLEIDGQLLASDWNWVGLEKTTSASGELHAVVTLKHAVRPVTVKVHTKLDGTAVLTRWLEVTNTGKAPAALAAVSSWSGVMQKTSRYQALLEGTPASLFSLGYFENAGGVVEGNFQWHEMPAAGYRIDGRYRRGRHRHPMFVVRNNATGEHFIGQLAWTGGYSFEFDLNTELRNEGAALTFRAGPDARPPQRVIAAGETVTTPEVHLGLVFGGLDASIQAMHTHLRRSVMMPQPRGRGGWIESGIGPEIEITHDEVIHAIDTAAQIGVEVFFIDASWYAPPKGNWWTTVGDWKVDLKRFPQGLKPFRDRAHAAGMLFGLWMDADRIGDESRVAKEHPDWLAMNYAGERRLGGVLDLTKPEVAKWMEDQIARVIEENQLEFYRLDYNTDPGIGIKTMHDGYIENGYWRYYEALYGVYDRLRARFPNVIFENCAGGGGRTDIGMVRRFSHTWVTDWQIAPRSFMITNGMTMALPPEYVDRLIGGQAGYLTADFDFQSRLLLFVRPTAGFLVPRGAQPNPHLIQRAKRWTDLYKNFVRPFMNTGRIYHHTPEVSGLDPHGWGVLELASDDRTRGMCGLFQLSAPSEPEYRLRLRGLDAGRRYRVTFDNSGQTAVVDGVTLMKEGITVRLEGALTSELLLFEAL